MIYAVHEGAATGQLNMERDVELANQVRQGAFQVAFRTYTWNPWTLSLGMHQKDDAYDLDALNQAGYGIVRRPTGGRAVFHADELTYCIAIRQTPITTPRSIYTQIHHLLLSAITNVYPQLAMDVASSSDNFAGFVASSTPQGKLCFATQAVTELMFEGKKVVGSAQRVVDGIILQHGSILCGKGYQELPEFLVGTSEEKQQARELVNVSSTGLEEALGIEIDVETLGNSITEFAINSFSGW